MKTSKFGWPEVTGFLSVALVLTILLIPAEVGATAASAEVNTPYRTAVDMVLVQGSNIVYAGTMVCVDSSGLVEHATDAASKKVVGRAEVTQDNTGSNYSATRTIRVRRGCFRWVNGDSFTDANIGDLAYVEDNQTVQKAASASQDIIAGVIIDVDSDGVWVDTHDIGSQGAGALTTLSTSGAASLGSTLAVTGAVTMDSTLAVTGASSLTGALNLTGAANMASTLKTTGACTFSNNVTVGKSQINTPETIQLTLGAVTWTPTNAVAFFAGQYGVATVTVAAASSPGMTLEIFNTIATNVVIEGSDVTFPSGFTAWTNGLNDGMRFRSVGTEWICTDTFNN